ncbi:MAG: 3-isopropylmalate dehydratase small subunit [Gammaproteobacteria bacterium]|nr:3-isopropylmalate dehydratase small subunit [Gammaproteobacteria bacterium]
MEAFTRLTGPVAPIDRPNVDTDAIIPKQFLKSIKRSGFGPNLFDEWRYLDKGEPDKANEGRPLNPDFILNQARYKGAQILLARDNFGCGSSREHAPWAIYDYGFRAVIAPSFADIFYGNSAKNGLLLVTLPADVVDRLFAETRATEGYALTIDLQAQTAVTPSGEVFSFDYAAGLKHRMLNGLDDIGMTLQKADVIRAYEAKRKAEAPWLFAET